MISGFRKLTKGYKIRSADPLQAQKEIAENWLGVDQAWLDSIIKRFPKENRLGAVKTLFAANQSRWERSIAYEMAAPARNSDPLYWKKRTLLDTIKSKPSLTRSIIALIYGLFKPGYKMPETLLEEIDEAVADKTRGMDKPALRSQKH